MKIEEAIVYVMVKRNGGMPVTSKQVYATICRFPEMFTKEAGRIMLMI